MGSSELNRKVDFESKETEEMGREEELIRLDWSRVVLAIEKLLPEAEKLGYGKISFVITELFYSNSKIITLETI